MVTSYDPSENQPGPWKMGYPQTITDTDIEALVSRVEVAARAVHLKTSDTLNKWFDILGEKKVIDSIRRLNNRLMLKHAIRPAIRDYFTYGWGYVYIAYADVSSESPTSLLAQPVRRATDVVRLQWIPYRKVVKVYEGQNGEWEGIEVRWNGIEKIKIHRSRVMRFGDGYTMFKPAYNVLVTWANLVYAVGEAAWRNASKIPYLILPPETPDDMWQWAIENFRDFNVKTEFVFQGSGIEIGDFYGADIIDAAKLHSFFSPAIAAALGIPRPVLFGTEAGKVTGAEYNVRMYVSDISNYQTEIVEPVLREFYDRLMDLGILPKGEYSLEWRPLIELTELERKEALEREAKVLQAIATALNIFNLNGVTPAEPWELYLDERGMVKIRVRESAPAAGDARLNQAPAPPDKYPYNDELAWKAESAKWGYKTRDIEPKLLADLTAVLAKWQDTALETLDQIAPLLDSRRHADADAFDVINAFKVRKRSYYLAIQKHTIMAFDTEAETTIELLQTEGLVVQGGGIVVLSEDPEVLKLLDSNAQMLADVQSERIVSKVKFELMEGVRNGESIQQIRERILKVFDTSRTNAETIARTEIIRASSEARLRNYAANTIQRVEFLVTYDERTCEECMSHAGQILTIDEARGMIPLHPNCRCTWVPESVFRR